MLVATPVTAAEQSVLERQRAAFVAAYAEAELGNWLPAEARSELLQNYVLWPDIRAAYLKTRIDQRQFSADDEAEILRFVNQYGLLRPARDLRYRYALRLASSGRLADFLSVYQQFYQGLEIARLDCLALQAEIQSGRRDGIFGRAKDLWLVGRSQEPECDPVFEYLRAEGMLDQDLYRQRYELAIDERQFALARYLSAPLAPSCREEATRWIAARDDPAAFVTTRSSRADSAMHRRQLLYALEQIAYRDPETASMHWQTLNDEYAFSEEQHAALSQYIALWAARRHSPQAFALLTTLPPPAVNTEVRRWTARSSLRRRDWNGVIESIAAMPADEQQLEEWQFWHASALRGISQQDHSLSILDQLSKERSYYGFLASDDLGRDYSFSHAASGSDGQILASLEKNEAVIRARELFLTGLDSKGRSEWDSIIGTLNAREKVQASLLAHRWGWHSRAISTAASAGEYDDLDIRYPLAYEQSFAQYSADAGISPSWAYGVARSESLFMSDVRSSAGAIGLMQLMPATGRSTAGEIQLPYAGVSTLVDPGSNIRLGTTYLGKMLKRFDRNPILATAAYNAGPSNVESWLPVENSVDGRIWIENIPFNETRKYVRRVLATEVIFHWRMTGEMRRVSEGLPLVVAPVPPDRITSSGEIRN